MDEVKRYDPMGYDKMSGYMKETPYGDYVSAEDYDKLRERVAVLEANIQRLSSNPADHRYWEGRWRDADAELAALKAQEPVFMWHKGATDDESEVVDVDCACPCCVPLYTAAVPAQPAVVIPERFDMQPFQTVDRGSTNYKAGWNDCLYEVARLNGSKTNEQ